MTGWGKTAAMVVAVPLLLCAGLVALAAAALLPTGCIPAPASTPVLSGGRAQDETTVTALAGHVTGGLGAAGGCVMGGWVLPLPAGSYRITSGYGPRAGGFHYGADLAAATGTPIHTVAAGIVAAAGCTSPFCDRPGALAGDGTPTTPGCGYRVQVRHAGGIATTYCHAVSLTVHTGQAVVAGQVVGYVGSTGRSTGPHLHLQVHQPAPPISNATTVDPLGFLRAAGLSP